MNNYWKFEFFQIFMISFVPTCKTTEKKKKKNNHWAYLFSDFLFNKSMLNYLLANISYIYAFLLNYVRN